MLEFLTSKISEGGIDMPVCKKLCSELMTDARPELRT